MNTLEVILLHINDSYPERSKALIFEDVSYERLIKTEPELEADIVRQFFEIKTNFSSTLIIVSFTDLAALLKTGYFFLPRTRNVKEIDSWINQIAKSIELNNFDYELMNADEDLKRWNK